MALTNFIDLTSVINAAWLNKIDVLHDSVFQFSAQYSPTFNSGYVAYVGPNGSLKFHGSLVYGSNIPNPTGINAPALLLGGAGIPRACLLTDEQIPGIKGIDLIVAAGNTGSDGGNSQTGGDLLLFGGGALNGPGGNTKIQGGTSVNGAAGDMTVKGGDCTGSGSGGAGHRGNVFIEGGELGNGGGNVEIIATYGVGTDGEIRFRFNSTTVMTLVRSGAVIFGAGAQSTGDVLVSQGVSAVPKWTQLITYAVKPAATQQASNTTLTNDAHMLVGLAVGKYEIEGFLMFNAGTLGTQGIKIGLAYSGTIVATCWVYDGVVNGSAVQRTNPFANFTTPASFATITTNVNGDWIKVKGVIEVSTVGTLSVQWAQNSSNAAVTQMLLQSYLKVVRML